MKISDYPKEIEAAALDLAATCEELSETRDRIKVAEIEALASVIAAKGENDKPLPTNDKARDIAVFFALRSDSSYCQDKATERILEHKKATLEAEIERLRREYRISLIDYEAERLGKRGAA
ncbi:MAG TPA: hypothetical protein VFQ92_14800 [Blastocatellia bacterium]|nr:hypothetical protein [Blastocatellia bacterium]